MPDTRRVASVAAAAACRRSSEKQRQHDSLHEPVDLRAFRPGPVEVRQAVEALALAGVNVVFGLLQATSAL